jgi:hypothetical protein
MAREGPLSLDQWVDRFLAALAPLVGKSRTTVAAHIRIEDLRAVLWGRQQAQILTKTQIVVLRSAPDALGSMSGVDRFALHLMMTMHRRVRFVKNVKRVVVWPRRVIVDWVIGCPLAVRDQLLCFCIMRLRQTPALKGQHHDARRTH